MNTDTTDTFFHGKIRITQDRIGYRFSIDAVLLAHFADPRSGDRVLDLGTGCGIIPLILAYRQPQITIYGVEVQTELATQQDGATAEPTSKRASLRATPSRGRSEAAKEGTEKQSEEQPATRKRGHLRVVK